MHESSRRVRRVSVLFVIVDVHTVVQYAMLLVGCTTTAVADKDLLGISWKLRQILSFCVSLREPLWL